MEYIWVPIVLIVVVYNIAVGNKNQTASKPTEQRIYEQKIKKIEPAPNSQKIPNKEIKQSVVPPELEEKQIQISREEEIKNIELTKKEMPASSAAIGLRSISPVKEGVLINFYLVNFVIDNISQYIESDKVDIFSGLTILTDRNEHLKVFEQAENIFIKDDKLYFSIRFIPPIKNTNSIKIFGNIKLRNYIDKQFTSLTFGLTESGQKNEKLIPDKETDIEVYHIYNDGENYKILVNKNPKLIFGSVMAISSSGKIYNIKKEKLIQKGLEEEKILYLFKLLKNDPLERIVIIPPDSYYKQIILQLNFSNIIL